jgi:hypothetical protein
MEILIMTIPGDVHAHAIRWVLERLGHNCRRWVSCDVGTLPATIQICSRRTDLALTGPDGEINGESIQSIWLRRFRMPGLPETLSPGDQTVASREMRDFLYGLKFAFPGRPFWANPLPAQSGALKIAQLAAAVRTGLVLPKTAVTNNMDVVRDFIRSVHGRVIYKGFKPAVWKNGTGQVVLQTVLLEENVLPHPDSLRYCPGIFQEFVRKAYELRITIFGRTCIAAKITDQDKVDWRSTHRMSIEPYKLPTKLEAKLFAFMEEMGLIMGTIDMIVTPEGEYVFLEINEQGQFLWVEERNPEVKLLEPFANFLAARDVRFQWKESGRSGLSFTDYVESSEWTEFRAKELCLASAGNTIVSD